MKHPNSVATAYVSIICIWSTTPLAIKWSSEGSSFLFGLSSRMTIGLIICLIISFFLKGKIPFDPIARKNYLIVGLGMYASMICVYWSSLFIASGLISIIFGLTPLVTGVIAHFYLDETLGLKKIFALLLGFVGLILIFSTEMAMLNAPAYAVIGVLLGVIIQSTFSVIIKKTAQLIPTFAITTGGLIVAVPLYLLTWFIFDGVIPANITNQAIGSIIYLGVFGSVVGFSLYFFIIKALDATQVALLTLITPLIAITIGITLNDEIFRINHWIGSSLILMGLALFQKTHHKPIKI